MGSLFTSSYRYNPQGMNYGSGAAESQAKQRENYAQQQALANQLMVQASGAGPSVAQNALKQATNRGIKQATAMTASQKGINPALAQRLAAEGAAQSTQEAAAQGATLRAQEQLAAQQGASGLYGQMGQENLTSQGQMLGASSEQNRINSGIEAQNAANISGLAGGVINAAGAALGMGPGMRKAAHGGKIEGKAQVDEDSEINDVVPAMLSPGEIVIPRSKSKDPEKAKEFIDKLMGSKEEEGEPSYGKILEAHKALQEKVKALEAKLKKK